MQGIALPDKKEKGIRRISQGISKVRPRGHNFPFPGEIRDDSGRAPSPNPIISIIGITIVGIKFGKGKKDYWVHPLGFKRQAKSPIQIDVPTIPTTVDLYGV
jgi:hypothetical protein